MSWNAPKRQVDPAANIIAITPSNATGILATRGPNLTTNPVTLRRLIVGGAGNVYVDVAGNNGLTNDAGSVTAAASATGTVTMSGTVNLAADSVDINGVTVSFTAGATDTLSATALKNAINALTTINGYVTATSALGVVTITATAGKFGNAVTTNNAVGVGVTIDQATLAGGTGGSGNYVKYAVIAGQTINAHITKVYALGTTATTLVGEF